MEGTRGRSCSNTQAKVGIIPKEVGIVLRKRTVGSHKQHAALGAPGDPSPHTPEGAKRSPIGALLEALTACVVIDHALIRLRQTWGRAAPVPYHLADLPTTI